MVRKCRKAKETVGASSRYMQLRSRRIVYRSVADDNGVSSSSCCESNNGVIDLQWLQEERDGETLSCRRSTKRKLFENLREDESMDNSPQVVAGFDSTVKESSDCCCSGRISPLRMTAEKGRSATEQPTADEIEDFFMEAEKQLHDKFKKKYNFDFEKEKALEGRYEWVKLSE